jgi:hypothetical protein
MSWRAWKWAGSKVVRRRRERRAAGVCVVVMFDGWRLRMRCRCGEWARADLIALDESDALAVEVLADDPLPSVRRAGALARGGW